ncbi:MAG: tRNA (adenosine(37)-N6)-threonylcarbamoyltransferase complex ATPase subunit type 1 TsaE [Candidatus Omnitrophica bacterium]|nr:tRNA (adenosine(37)-N6)-threonylcarbamoyltransferase complex ATPase subunit type 1 TsaE [Candidatus Omnitrophota bacterium]
MKITTRKPQETSAVGKALARHLQPGDIILLVGDLGSGKTTFVKGVAAGLRLKPDAVHSPTFVLMNIYEGRLPLFHFDLYRLDPGEQMNGLGLDEFLYGDGVALVEWADRMGGWTPREYLRLDLTHGGEEKRTLVLKAKGARYRQLLENVKAAFR